MNTTFYLPERFALRCPSCHSGQLHDGHPGCDDCGFTLQNEDRIVLLEHAPSEEDYSSEGADTQERVKDDHFWFIMRNQFILELTAKALQLAPGKRFVEYGSSNGLVMKKLEQQGWDVLGNDMHLTGLRNALSVVRGPMICAPLEKVEFETPVDAVGFFDVIEHLEDDFSALKHAVDQLTPGGCLLVTVPALQKLWSHFDVILGHKRRYSTGMLDDLFSKLGLKTVHVRYAFFFSYPIVRMQRKTIKGDSLSLEQRRKYYQPPHPIVNSVLMMLCRLELLLVRCGFKPPFGTSVMGVAQKPE